MTRLSRYWMVMIVALLLGDRLLPLAQAEPPEDGPRGPSTTPASPEPWPADFSDVPGTELSGDTAVEPQRDFKYDPDPAWLSAPGDRWHVPLFSPKWLGLRHSHTHGRNVGRGKPLVGTSWRNRPYYAGGELGALWITRSVDENVTRDADAFGGVFAGWDWDHYWGSELRFDWATPELKNTAARDADRTDSLFTWSYSYLYYPWGDSKIRPYWRCGVGNTHFDYPLDDGSRDDEWTPSFPLGFGVKYPVRRWLAARAELNDHLTIDDRLPTMNNVTFTLGLEWHFGAHPPSYWPWNPSRHIW